MANAGEFLIGLREQRAKLGLEGRIRERDEKQVGDAFKGIVDLVGNGGCEASCSGKFF